MMNHSQTEKYAASSIISELLKSNQIFVHHDLIEPRKRASAAHFHSTVEEIVYVIKGSPTIVFNGVEQQVDEGSFFIFDPGKPDFHSLVNHTNSTIETLSFSLATEFDIVTYEGRDEGVLDLSLPAYHFDEKLRDVPDNILEWKKYCKKLEEILEEEAHPEKQLSIIETLGVANRTLERLDIAESYLIRAIGMSARHPRHTRLLQNWIRLAHVYQWSQKFDQAFLLFKQAQAFIETNPVSNLLKAAYHQHLGKLYFDQRKLLEAKNEFQKALAIREAHNAPSDQIESTQFAIETTNKILEQQK